MFVGADGRWWRAFPTSMCQSLYSSRAKSYPGETRTVMDDPEYTRDVFERLRPNVPKWLPDWLDAYLIVIDLEV